MNRTLLVALQVACVLGALALIALGDHSTAAAVAAVAAALTPAATRRGRCALGAAALLALAGPTAAAQDDDRDPPLSVVEDADSQVYLLGSDHVLPEGALPPPAPGEAAEAAEVEVLAFELDMDALEVEAPAAMQAGVGGMSVARALSPEQKAAFDAFVGDLGMPEGALDAVEPRMAGLAVGMVVAQRSGLTGEGVDIHFWAHADAKERVALETLALQIGTLDGLAVEGQVAFLTSAAEEDESPADQLAELFAAWESGEDDALVVVGAVHLVGADSVVEMVRQRGHTVTRL